MELDQRQKLRKILTWVAIILGLSFIAGFVKILVKLVLCGLTIGVIAFVGWFTYEKLRELFK